MQRAFVSVLRFASLLCFLAVLHSMDRPIRAQSGGGSCQTFDPPDYDLCDSCCTKLGKIPLPPYPTGNPGTFSPANEPWSCGTVVPGGCPATCSGWTVVAQSDGSCCIQQGQACSSYEPCCTGTTCQNGTCVAQSTGGGGSGCIDGHKNGSGNCGSPILIDVNGKGFFLTSAQAGVRFDMSGTGNPVQMGWTAGGADNAFLALPGADGTVHDGTQLFGDFTPQPPSDHPNGFAALAVYDKIENGGNGDGIIDSRDAVFAYLRLWVDQNHDGVCQKEELYTLPELGVNSISLKYRKDDKTDQYGNVFRYRAAVNPDDPDASSVDRKAYDVFFVTLASPQ